jgi:methylated-DNA-[protein]-cysteine S-methyltransferase
MFEFDSYESQIGRIYLVVRDGKLCSVDFSGYEARFEQLLTVRYGKVQFEHRSNPAGATARLARYFEGDFTAFNGLDVETGGTAFQQQVWTALKEIPAGKTWSYADLANFVGSPKGFRAVGHANSLNPVAIVLPCHRVIGTNKSLTGFGGGLPRKKWLLEHEGALPQGLLLTD